MNKFIGLGLFIMCLFVVACSDNNNENGQITPFFLDKTYYEVRLGRGATSISITNGSGEISLAIEDESILQAIYSEYNDTMEEDNPKGHINLYGMRKGCTTLTITDNITKEKETVEVKVTDCYLAYNIYDSNHPVLKTGTILFWVNNQAHDYYLFDQNYIYDKPIFKGYYEFFITMEAETFSTLTALSHAIPNLRLNCTSSTKENYANEALKCYDFQIVMRGEDSSSPYILQVIQAYLGVDWEKLMDNALTKSSDIVDMTMIMTVPNTDYRIRGVLGMGSIPEHILD